MNKEDIFIKGLKNGLFMKYEWVIRVFCNVSTKGDTFNIPYFFPFKVKGKWYYNDDTKKMLPIDDTDNLDILFRSGDKIDLPKDTLPNVKKNISTTAYIAFANAVILTYPLGDKVDFINGEISLRYVGNNIVAKSLVTDSDNPKFNLNNLFKLYEAADYIGLFTEVFTISSTEKNILPPPGIKEEKDRLIKELGHKPSTEKEILWFIDKLKEFDNKALADDPSLNKFIDGKIKDVARVKTFLTLGKEDGINSEGVMITESLYEGIPTDADTVADTINVTRAGSYFRGKKTAIAGVIISAFNRANSNLTIKQGDCGTTYFLDTVIEENTKNKYINLYYKKGKNIEKITSDNVDALIGKSIKLRSPMYCIEPGSNYCSICVGDSIAMNKDGINLFVSNMTKPIIDFQLQAIHGRQLQGVDIDIDDIIT